MQDMIEKLTHRGHTEAEAQRIIKTFETALPSQEHYKTIEQVIDDVCRVLDSYKLSHGEYIKLVMPE